MPRYRKKPIIVSAEQFWPENKPWPEGVVRTWCWSCSRRSCRNVEHKSDSPYKPDSYLIEAVEVDMKVTPGDWIVTGIMGERYPVKDEIFRETFEPVPEQELTHKEFFDFMEENSKVVAKMPSWMKGSPVNRREPKKENPNERRKA